ncbi:imidazoleglycerol-phosphate dehydratase HisB [Paraliomyxa miuraensis]|uniref:imidazoleglycerol-phosphate dehydratase HisB n=1 Tax=Paraliomyxa miuraensis TaxID=376150 RepID=UPI002256E9ED|nr:imidazoleglycerol-phosphate dehydratase HisB [Paraliomyxa miuraensis]MCX4239534.1 imidazoleglycerol-phosphate dehydratase HisB [Paraliomyxa miuraensis]
MSEVRRARVERRTKETQIVIELCVPGDAPAFETRIATPVPFLSHMLEALAKHGAMALRVEAQGDVEIDDHHTVEDVGLTLGMALDQALGERRGITRYGCFSLAMDETLVDCALDLGGRPYLVHELPAIAGKWIGRFDCDLVEEFFQALVVQARMNLHLHLRAGGNAHHVVEAAFKGFARALRMACALDPALMGALPSTKGAI